MNNADKETLYTVSSYEARFSQPTEGELSGYTKITCTHAYHRTMEFWVSASDFQDNVRSLITPYWINSYVIVMQSCD